MFAPKICLSQTMLNNFLHFVIHASEIKSIQKWSMILVNLEALLTLWEFPAYHATCRCSTTSGLSWKNIKAWLQIFLQWGVHEVSTSAFCNHRGGRIISMTLFPSLYNSWGQNIIQAIPSQFGIFSDGCISYSGLLIDCFNTIEYFRFQFCSQNHCLFFFDYFFQKNRKSIAFAIVCENGVILRNQTASFRPKTWLVSETWNNCHGFQQRVTNISLRSRDSTK